MGIENNELSKQRAASNVRVLEWLIKSQTLLRTTIYAKLWGAMTPEMP